MGWYAGQAGSLKYRLRNYLNESVQRFKSFLGPSVTILDFTDNIEDVKDTSVVRIMLHNPASQQEVIDEINTKGAASDAKLAIAIPFSWHLQNMDGISDNVCQRLEGLFLFGTSKLNLPSLLNFILRCPNIKALTLRGWYPGEGYPGDGADYLFAKQLFTSNALPALELIETSFVSDAAIAAMVSSPNLSKIIFVEPNFTVTNEGFRALVKAGGGKNLKSIQAGTLAKDQSKTLSSGALAVILQGMNGTGTGIRCTHMPQTLRPLPQDKEPFAVVPVERMDVKQLKAAIEARGLVMPKPAIKVNYEKALWEAGFDMEEEKAIQAGLHIKSLNRLKPCGYVEKISLLQAIHDDFHANKRRAEAAALGAESVSNKKLKVSTGNVAAVNKENIGNAEDDACV